MIIMDNSYNPQKTAVGYKIFEMDRDGNLKPLFIEKNIAYPIGIWIKGEFVPTKGFAPRAGIHLGVLPSAIHLMDSNGNYKGRNKGWRRVWCEVEYDCTNDYNEEVSKLPKKCFTDSLPADGWYRFREFGKLDWILSDKIKINKILTEDERQAILKLNDWNEQLEWEKKFKPAFDKRMGRAS